jgi:exodeoxyribonuclease III
MATTLRIASWNINSVRARIDIVERFLREEAPDILCLQETKVADPQFPEGPFRQLGYNHMAINGQPMHHGVAILSKVPLKDKSIHDWQANGEARHVGVIIADNVRLENVYIPAGGDIPDREQNTKFGQKLDFLERMTEWSAGVTGRNRCVEPQATGQRCQPHGRRDRGAEQVARCRQLGRPRSPFRAGGGKALYLVELPRAGLGDV